MTTVEPGLSFEEIRRFCRTRPIELAISRNGSKTDGLTLHADFEHYGDFFSIDVDDLEYVDLVGRLWVGGLELGDWRELSATKAKWTPLASEFSGPALAIWATDAKTLTDAAETECYLIVGNSISFRPGRDWPAS